MKKSTPASQSTLRVTGKGAPITQPLSGSGANTASSSSKDPRASRASPLGATGGSGSNSSISSGGVFGGERTEKGGMAGAGTSLFEGGRSGSGYLGKNPSGGGNGGGAGNGWKRANGGLRSKLAEKVSVATDEETDKYGTVQLLWAHLSANQIDELLSLNEPEEELPKFVTWFGLGDWKENLHSSMILSLYHSIYTFAKENLGSSPAKISTFFSLMKVMSDRCADKSYTHSKSLSDFKKLLSGYISTSTGPAYTTMASQPFGGRLFPNGLYQTTFGTNSDVNETGPPVSATELFSPSDCKAIIDFAMTTFFQHYKLYQFAFTTEQEREDVLNPVTLEVPPTFASLAESMTLEAYEAEQRAKEQIEREQRLAQERNIDVLDSLPPEEVKKVVVNVIGELLEGLSVDFDKMLLEQRTRIMNAMSKISLHSTP